MVAAPALLPLLACALAWGAQGLTHRQALPSGEDFHCKAAGNVFAKRAEVTRRVALLLRGESFRAVPGSPLSQDFAGKQYGEAKRTTCFDEATFSYQQQLANGLLKNLEEMKKEGYTVDLFGATFNCVNGKDYVQRLPELYGHAFQELRVLSDEERESSRQITLIQRGLDMIDEHMKSGDVVYERVYILRWDNTYGCEHFRLSDRQEYVGNSRSLSGEGNPDKVLMVTAKYLPCFLEFVRLPYEDGKEHRTDRCCRATKCGGGDCNRCVESFVESVYHDSFSNEYTPPQSSTCPRYRSSPVPAWVPKYDDPKFCHPQDAKSPEG